MQLACPSINKRSATWSAAAEKCILGQGDLKVKAAVLVADTWQWMDGVYRCEETIQAAVLIASIQIQTSLCPKAFYKKIVPLVFRNKTCINGFFHGKPLALQIIQTVSVSSLLCFLALNPPPNLSKAR